MKTPSASLVYSALHCHGSRGIATKMSLIIRTQSECACVVRTTPGAVQDAGAGAWHQGSTRARTTSPSPTRRRRRCRTPTRRRRRCRTCSRCDDPKTAARPERSLMTCGAATSPRSAESCWRTYSCRRRPHRCPSAASDSGVCRAQVHCTCRICAPFCPCPSELRPQLAATGRPRARPCPCPSSSSSTTASGGPAAGPPSARGAR